jgi:YHS domain-containing protein
MQEKSQNLTENLPPEPRPINVCGRAITNDPVYHYPTEYQGRIIYFCTEFCLEAFLADPDRFYTAHSTKKA